MKKQYLLFFVLIITAQSLFAQIVNIPDANFKLALTTYFSSDTDGDIIADTIVDTNGDGEIQQTEAEAVEVLIITNRNISSLEGIASFTNLKHVRCLSNNLTSFDISSNLLLEVLECGYNQLTNLDISANINLKRLITHNNQISNLDVSSNPNLEVLIVDTNQLSALDVSTNSNLIELDAGSNNLSSIDLSSNTNLEAVELDGNGLTSLDVSMNINLKRLRFTYNQITNLDVSSNPSLTRLLCNNNLITNLNISNNPELITLNCGYNQLTSIDISSSVNLEVLSCRNNNLANINVTNNTNLKELDCRNNMLTLLDVSANTILEDLDCRDNILTHMDVSTNLNLIYFWVFNNQLETLYLKNGSHTIQFFNFSNNPALQYICADENEISVIQNLVNSYGYTDCVVNSYCSFSPGGTLYTVSGEAKLDTNANGCDMNDQAFPNISFSITNGSDTGIFTADTSGNYEIPLSEGTHTITPQLENSTYFTVSPTSVSVDFPTDASPNIQDFCITPNGTYNDLEIIIIPLEEARPGFDTEYKIIYKNKGTTTLSGTVNLLFEDDFMDVVSASPTANTQNTGSLSWSYTNLASFETRSIVYTMNLNTPTDANFPLNGDDELSFTGTVTPTVSDETLEDNVIVLEQIVVNSFDPNDKTCLEGNEITTDKVGDFVHYLIRFENTGTASAINVVVKDDIDAANYDISTLSVIDGSHDFVTRVAGQKVEFVFENINLPFDDATNDGYVLFKIKTKSTLVANDTFMNKAEIFFDFNAPIITNDEMTTVAAPLSINEILLDATMVVFPKPTTETLFISAENPIQSIDLYSLQGKLILSKKIIGNQTNVNISVKSLSKGLYILKATSTKGVFIDKIIKQ
ncbi:MAG: T9SS type A sorting domain-containing protein [Kordia sp.]|uniref:T9SS type A sorting domain-containing protein n=1 Tax=Kordia sp. TaxID=1965332 RepID=UPI003859DF97